MLTRSGRIGEEPPILIVSNRGPYEHELAGDGSIRALPGQGGVATALRIAADFRRTIWLSSPLTAGDRILARRPGLAPDDTASRRYVSVEDSAYRLFYECFANEVLWFLQHEMPWREGLEPEERRDAWQRGYAVVNQAFADAVVAEVEAGRARAVMIHDYHFYTAPALIRESRPDLYLQHFVHIPWPAPAVWRRLDADIVAGICEGLLGNDAVFFQTPESVENFLATCRAFLPAVVTDGNRVRFKGRQTRAAAQPISVDADELRALQAQPEFATYAARFAPREGEQLVVRVDRLDPSKNVYAGFEAFERLLEEHVELRGKVRFLAFLVPTRGDVPAYRHYQERTLALVERINARFGAAEWQPITVRFENNRLQALAGLKLADAILINPLADGMNLVAKEAALLNQRGGVMVLSTRAGAYRELGGPALGIEPTDVAATAAALYQALTLPAAERHDRARRLQRQVIANDLRTWFAGLLEDLENAKTGPILPVAAPRPAEASLNLSAGRSAA